jgi:hypothetical protein
VTGSLDRRLSRSVRRATGAVALALVCLGILAAGAPAQSIVRANNCTLTGTAGYGPVSPSGHEYEVLATHSTRSVARRLASLIRSQDIFATYERLLSSSRLLVSRHGKLPIFIVPRGDPYFRHGSAGATGPVCRSRHGSYSNRDAIIIPDTVEHFGSHHRDIAEEVLGHEIFHAFEHGLAGRNDYGPNWLDEAAAQWATELYFHVSAESRQEFDEAFLLHPGIPLEHFGGMTNAELAHPYGAWRLLQLMSNGILNTRPVVRLLIDVYHDLSSRPGSQAFDSFVSHFPAGMFRHISPAGGEGLTEELLYLWESHLYHHTYAFGDGGPVVPMQQHDTMPSGLANPDGLTRRFSVTAQPHSAATIEIALPDGDPLTVTANVPAESAFGYATASDPGGAIGFGPYDSTGPPYSGSAVCAPADGDTLRFVFVNGSNSPQSGEVQLIAGGTGSYC